MMTHKEWWERTSHCFCLFLNKCFYFKIDLNVRNSYKENADPHTAHTIATGFSALHQYATFVRIKEPVWTHIIIN